jgi:M3 family oligoendopeptidase
VVLGQDKEDLSMKFSEMPYERVDLAQAEKEYAALMEEFQAAKSGEEQFVIHQRYYKLTNRIGTQYTIAQIRHDIDTTDAFYEKEQAYYDEIMPKLTNLEVAYRKLMYESPYRSFLEEKIGKVAFKNMELAIKATDEKLIPLMQEENALTTEYDKLIAGAKIDWEGETLNLSLLQKYMKDKDRGVRKKAWEKYNAFFEEKGEALDSIYDRLVKCRTEQARQKGYENYLELGYYRMNRNCYDKKMVESFRKQVKEVLVPFAQKLHEKRRERLKVEKLTNLDEGVYFKEGNPAPKGTPEEILLAGQKMYGELSEETKEFFDFMTENQLFDVLGRKTKKAGGYMTYLPDYHAPFIFANFNGTSGDVDVMTHECGHAFQGYLSGFDKIEEHREITMETAEIHSMSMEFFTEKYMELFFDKDADAYRTMHLEDSVAFIPYGCMVDEFQHIVYENPDLTPAERHAAWKKLEAEYRPYLSYEESPYFEKGGFWQKQLHIYDYPLYYIDYCLAQSCALQYKAWMDEDYEKAWESYLTLCRLSASDFYTNMIKEVGLDSPFEEQSMQKLVQKMEQKLWNE